MSAFSQRKNERKAALGAVAMAIAFSFAAGCGVPDDGPSMQPGQDCLACHNGSIAPAWTVAGTVFADPNAPVYGGLAGAQVIVTDANQRTLTMTSNSVGNFYTAEALAFPLAVQIQRGTFRLQMSEAPSSGSCNTCHNQPKGDPDVPGRLFIPYQNLSP